ncbi:Uncharacterized protein ToN1_46070 [Aromatoleum petrolei]|nr:Uncharacterized protein ToN1_46070 [Aromatoleum petrolei]
MTGLCPWIYLYDYADMITYLNMKDFAMRERDREGARGR